jgi:hypothetical protein
VAGAAGFAGAGAAAGAAVCGGAATAAAAPPAAGVAGWAVFGAHATPTSSATAAEKKKCFASLM